MVQSTFNMGQEFPKLQVGDGCGPCFRCSRRCYGHEICIPYSLFRLIRKSSLQEFSSKVAKDAIFEYTLARYAPNQAQFRKFAKQNVEREKIPEPLFTVLFHRTPVHKRTPEDKRPPKLVEILRENSLFLCYPCLSKHEKRRLCDFCGVIQSKRRYVRRISLCPSLIPNSIQKNPTDIKTLVCFDCIAKLKMDISGWKKCICSHWATPTKQQICGSCQAVWCVVCSADFRPLLSKRVQFCPECLPVSVDCLNLIFEYVT